MSRDAKINLKLLIIVIILSLVAWYKPGIHPTVFNYLSALKADDIKTIIIDRQDIGQIKLSHNDNGWFLQEPYQLPANPQRVQTITALAQKRSYSSFQVSDEDLSRFQLDKPLIAIWLNESKFVIGSEAPVNGQRYAMNIDANIQANQNSVHLINGTVFYQLRANLDSFISPHLLPPKASIKSITWHNKKLVLDQGKWQLTTDDPDTSSDSIAQFLQFWKQARASRVETNVTVTLDNAELVKSKTILIQLDNIEPGLSSLEYLIVQEGEQIKLLRTDIQVAYWITPQILKLLTEFVPVPEKT